MITDPNELTPVESYQVKGNNIYIKRDDLFTLTDLPISGGKVRQAYQLLSKLKPTIVERHNNTVATVTNVDSSMGIIVSAVAHHLGMKTVIGVGGKVKFDKYPTLSYPQKHFNTELKILSGIAYTSQLYKEAERLQAKEGFFIVRFFTNLESHPDCILDSLSLQVKNIPSGVDNLIVAAGSGITASAILLGLHKYIPKEQRPNQVIVIQTSGNDRRADMQKIINQELGLLGMRQCKHTYIADPTHPYNKHLRINEPIQFDSTYEAKAWEYALKNNLLTNNSLFWNVGNIQPVRDYCEKNL